MRDWLVPGGDRLHTPHRYPPGHSFNRPVELAVVHWTATGPGDEGWARNWLSGQGRPVSTHFVILRDGRVLQGASLQDRTWHAGDSSFPGVESVNASSIGVDMANRGPVQGGHEPYTRQQVASLQKLVTTLAQEFPALRNPSRWTGHQDVAPGRKIDPGPLFPWDVVRRAVRSSTVVPDQRGSTRPLLASPVLRGAVWGAAVLAVGAVILRVRA